MERMLGWLDELMRCAPVSSDIEAVNQASDVVRRHLAAEGLHVAVEDVDGRQTVFAATESGRAPGVLLNAHVDVIPAEPEQFVPVRDGGWLVGRGACDCLGQTALCMELLCRLRGVASVGAVFSTDEEIGGESTAAMVERGYGARELVLVVDGGAYAISIAQKGVLTVRLTARGRSCHASMPWEGDNAIERLLDGFGAIRDMFPPVTPGDEWHNTMAFTCVRGGTAANRVPDEAELVLNIRYTEPENREEILGRLAAASGLDVAVDMECPPVVFDETLPVFGRLQAAMVGAFRREIPLQRLNGATDARHFITTDAPVAIIGAPGRGIHGADEAVDVAGLGAYADMLEVFLRPETASVS